jgi:hypothetical protein
MEDDGVQNKRGKYHDENLSLDDDQCHTGSESGKKTFHVVVLAAVGHQPESESC